MPKKKKWTKAKLVKTLKILGSYEIDEPSIPVKAPSPTPPAPPKSTSKPILSQAKLKLLTLGRANSDPTYSRTLASKTLKAKKLEARREILSRTDKWYTPSLKKVVKRVHIEKKKITDCFFLPNFFQ